MSCRLHLRGMALLSLAVAVAAAALCPALAADLPEGFVRLADVDPTIRQDIRYAGSENFMGRPVAGYGAAECILTREAAAALAEVQKAVEDYGLTLLVFDCYRPVRAVDDFVRWTKEGGPVDPRWHPTVKRGDLIADGYIGEKSAHSRGSTVDLALAPLQAPFADEADCGAQHMQALEFGTGFDCFDPKSRTDFAPLPTAAAINRRKLVQVMAEVGFRNYESEWWHFTLKPEPFKKRFDFPIESKP